MLNHSCEPNVDNFSLSVCKQSSYFRATFAGEFQEGVEQSANLTEEDGVVLIRSFQLLVQWLYLGRVIFGELAAEAGKGRTGGQW
jgi:hypothetical protein